MSKIPIVLILIVLLSSCEKPPINLKAYQNEGKDFEISIPKEWDVKVSEEEIIAKQGGWEDFFSKLKVSATYKRNWGTFEPITEEILSAINKSGSLKYQNNLRKITTDTYTMYTYDLRGPAPLGGTVTFRKYEVNIHDKPEDSFILVVDSFNEFNSDEERFMKAIIASLKFL
ncbi:hypothetical protein [uncultured Kordia sp.]|uniref:hypothetical protein n=1 Tax=uncultured Kordia sp. TaxID=507699 RepID=UPI0026071C80|nr:hypothetical protein [uncultured Kordia sp.]